MQCHLDQIGLPFRSEVMSYYTQCLQGAARTVGQAAQLAAFPMHHWSAVHACSADSLRGGVVTQGRQLSALALCLQSCSSGPPHLRKLVSISRLQIPLHFRHELVQRGCQVGLLLILQTITSQMRSTHVQHAMASCIA